MTHMHAEMVGPNRRTGLAMSTPVSRAAAGGRVTEQLSTRRMMWAQTCAP